MRNIPTAVARISLVALFFAPLPAGAAWKLHKSNGDANTAWMAVGAGSPSIAAAVGFTNATGNTQPMFARTANGDTWSEGGFSQYATAIEFAGETTGYVGDMNGKVWRTGDGGATWSEVQGAVIGGTLVTGETIADIAISGDGASVWIVGVSGRSSYSRDNGETWTRVDLTLPGGDDLRVTAVELAGDTVWIAGGIPRTEGGGATDSDSGASSAPASDGFVLRSDDGGETFEAVASGLEYDLMDISFVGADRGWAAAATYASGGGAVGVTEDGGATWEFSTLPPLPAEEVPFAAMGGAAEIGACVRTRFFGARVGVVSCTARTVDVDGTNALFLTDDGGATWTLQTGYKAMFVQEMNAMSEILDIAFPDCRRGWLVGGGKVIMRWDNDDQTLDCEAGGAPDGSTDSSDTDDGAGETGAEADERAGDCGCETAGAEGGSSGALLAALLG